MAEQFIIAILVENKPGVLHKVSNLIRRRNFNIESISAGLTELKNIVRITLTVKGDKPTRDQIVKQLKKLVEVVYAWPLSPENSVQRELALVKLKVKKSESRREIMDYASIFRGRIIDASKKSVIVEITGDADKVNAFINLVGIFEIAEVARTGMTALQRGEETVSGNIITRLK